MALTAQRLPQLSSPLDWITWYDMIKTTAIDNDVWSYCDPDGINEITPPGDPSQLTTAIQERLYTHRIQDYERKRKGLAIVNTTIQSTVSEGLQTYLQNAHTPRQRLVRLRTAIEPSIEQVEDAVQIEYESLMRGPKRSAINSWLDRWIALAPRLQALNIPNLGEQQACRGFIKASEISNPTFFQSAMHSISKTESESQHSDATTEIFQLLRENLSGATQGTEASDSTAQEAPSWLTLYDRRLQEMREKQGTRKLTILGLVGQYKRMMSSDQAKQSRASFATFQGRKHNREDNDSQSDQEEDASKQTKKKSRKTKDKKSTDYLNSRVCICGKKHAFEDCYYLVPQRAPDDWEARDLVQAKIIRLLNGNKKLKENVLTAVQKAGFEPPDWFSRQNIADAPTVYATGRAAF